MKKILNEWKEFLNKAQHINEEQKALDPDKISQARLAGATDYREHGSMEQGDYYLKTDNGDYFEEYEDAYYTAREEEDRQDYYRDLDDDSNEEEVAASSFDKRKQQIVKIHDGFVDFLEVEDIFPMGEIPKSVMDALMKAAMLAVDAMENDLDERCQKGYKTHPKRKTKKMYGKTYRNCVKAEE